MGFVVEVGEFGGGGLLALPGDLGAERDAGDGEAALGAGISTGGAASATRSAADRAFTSCAYQLW